MGTKTQEYFAEGLAVMHDPERKGCLECECGWSGKELSYADEDGKGQTLTKGRYSYPNHRLYDANQGHCPECGRPFVGCYKH